MSSYDNVRQQKVSERRKESGYQTKRLYFFAKDLERIEKIAEEMGYDGKLSDEEYSAVLRSCIAARYSETSNKTVEKINTKDKQYTYTLKQIVRYRLKQKDEPSRVITFLNEWRYGVPNLETLTGKHMRSYKEQVNPSSWCLNWIEALRGKRK